MLIQIEVTTVCNFQCFYCAGRDMAQRHMPMDLFTRILRELPTGPHVVSLQGEGEPTMHPQWWNMVAQVRAAGHAVQTITNGYLVDNDRLAQEIDEIAVSVDTLDADEATRIGRYKLPRVLHSVEQLLEKMGAARLRINTVDYGQDLEPLREWVRSRGLRHVIQPLQPKADYAYRYPEKARPRKLPRGVPLGCQYLEQPIMRYYDLNAVEMPCCYIKDANGFESIEALRSQLRQGETPRSCEGCNYLMPAALLQRSAARTPAAPKE